MTSFRADISELLALEGDLQSAASDAVGEVRQVVAKGSLNIKRAWQQRWSGHPHIAHLPRTITYDVNVTRDTVTGETGPEHLRGGQAPLGGVIENGTPTSAPIPGGAPALEAEVPRFEQALADLGVRLVER